MWAVVKTYHCNDLHIRTYILELITRSLRAKVEFKGTGLFAMLSRTFRFSRPVRSPVSSKCPGPGQRKEILSVRRSQVREYHLKISFRMFDTFWYIYVYIYCNILYYGFIPKNQSCLKRTEKEDNLHFFALWQSGLSLCFTPETVWWSLLRFAGRNSVPWRSFDQPCGAATNIDDLCLQCHINFVSILYNIRYAAMLFLQHNLCYQMKAMFRDDEMLINSCKDGSWHPFMTAAMQCPFTKCMLKPFGSHEFPSFFCQTWNDLNQLVWHSAKLRMILAFVSVSGWFSVLFSDIDNSDSAALHTLWEYNRI